MEKNIHVPLCDVPIGATAQVKRLDCMGHARRRMLDLGLITDTMVQALGKSPFGDPTAYCIRGAVIALRNDEAKQILVALD